jgi:glutamate-1-semialdehyde 2,1-aminomutase
VYQAGTLSGNPLGVAAGLTTLKLIERDPPYEKLEAQSAKLFDGLAARAEKAGLAFCGNRVGAMFTGFFQAGPVHDYADAKRSDLEKFAAWHRAMLERGVYLAPSQFEAAFVSTAHDDAAIERTLNAAQEAFAAIA